MTIEAHQKRITLGQQAIADGGGLDIDQDCRAVESGPMSELDQQRP
jgi:hypothetical protein